MTLLKLTKTVSTAALACALVLSTLQARADNENSLIDLTIEQVQEDLMEIREQRAREERHLPPRLQYRLRKYDPASWDGKIIIQVHKSNDPEVLEYLEVFIQTSKDPTNLVPQHVFDQGRSSRALVSTGGKFGGRPFATPAGVFSLDAMKPMHYSSKYNNAPMPWTLFFHGGIALHATHGAGVKNLGQKASHGCVRLHPTNAKLLYDFIKQTADEPLRDVIVMVLES